MGMLFEKNMYVILKRGSLAGKKAIVTEVEDDYLVVCGIRQLPGQRKLRTRTTEVKYSDKFLTFYKRVNIKHVLATRYSLDTDLFSLKLENNFSQDKTQNTETNKSINKQLLNLQQALPNSWLLKEFKF